MSVAQPLRISYIELRSAKDVEFVEILFPGCRRSIRQRAKNHFREEFPQPLAVQGEAFSFSVHRKSWYSPIIPAINNIQINVRDVLSESRSHKFQTERSKLDITVGLSSDRPSADVVPTQDNSTSPKTDSPRPTTEALLNQCPRFRILTIGQSGVGKSTLIKRAFGIESSAFAGNLKSGPANTVEELISPQNNRAVWHNSNDLESAHNVNCDAVKSFIADVKKREHVKDQLHAVWLCFRIPIISYGDRLLEGGAETFLQKHASVLQNIPTIVVFTKYDKLLAYMAMKNEVNPEVAATRYLQKHCINPIANLAGGTDLSYVAVSSKAGLERSLKQLIRLTHQKVTERFTLQIDTPSPVSIMFLMAQRILPDLEILRSIDVCRQRYWTTLTPSASFKDHTINECLAVIHTDIVCMWGFNDPLQYLYSNEFRGLMANLVGITDGSTASSPRLAHVDTTSATHATGLPRMFLAPLVPPFGADLGQVHWTRQSYQQLPNVHHKFMTYIIDLVHILEILFSLTAGNKEKKLTLVAVSSAFYVYYDSEMRRNVHRRIDGFDYKIPGRDTILDSIASLVRMSPIDDNDISRALGNIPSESLAADLQEIIAIRRSALQLTAEGHPERVVSLINLADSLYVRFEREGSMKDLQEIIALRRSALQLTLEGHLEHIVALVNLADSLHERFKRKSSMEDLREIIALRRSALQLTLEGHPEHVVALVNLADSLHECFKREGGTEDLQEIIVLRRSALQFTPRSHPKRVVALVNLADSLHERFKREGGMKDLQEIIALRRSALQFTPLGHPGRFLSLVNLGDNLRERFKKEGGVEDLQEIITLRRSALRFTPEGHPERVAALVNLADSLHERFKRKGGVKNLQEIIALRRSALRSTPRRHPKHVVALVNLADSLHERFKKEGGMEDLQEIVTLRRSALQFTPPGRPGHFLFLVNLGDSLHERFRREGSMEDLQEIIILRRSALQLTPEGHPEHVVSLVNLANSLHKRFKRKGGMKNLQEIIALRRSALQLTPEGHPERDVSLANLADSLHERFKREGSMEDLQEIIALRRSALQFTPQGHSKCVVALVNLADSLYERFRREGGTENLQEIIALQRSALQFTPPGHPGHFLSLVNLGDSLHEHFKRDGGLEDLQEIIALRRSALQLTPERHPKRIITLVNLADSLYERFKRQGSMKDLQEIIALRRSALQFTPPGHPGRFLSLVNLGDSLCERFKKEGGVEDLQEIIALRRSALQLTPEGHPEHVVALVSLADSLHEQFKRKSDMKNLQEIIALRRSALQLTPEGHPERVVSLVNLVDSLHEHFRREGGMEDLQEIIALRRSALQFTPQGDPKRVTALVNLADSLHEHFKREGSMEDLQEIIVLRRSALQFTPEQHPEHIASLVSLVDSLHEHFRREGSMKDLQEIITLQRSALQLTPEGHAEHVISLINLADSLRERFKREDGMEDLQEIIAFRRSALQLTPEGHPERVVSLVSLVDSLQERFKRKGGMEDLQEIITLQHSTLQLTPEGHPERDVSLANLADSLHERFKREGSMEDLQEIIAFRRSALQFTPPGHPRRFLSLVNFSNSLHERFIKGGTLADLDEIIAFRRAASECTAPTSSDQCMSLLNLAGSLREKYQRLGVDADLAEAIKYACAASERCPLEKAASCRDCIASCVELKARKRRVSAPTVQAIDFDVRLSGIKQMVRKVFAETFQTLPLRLLNTYTGVLCDRDAQISCFEDSAEYKELQASICDSPERELSKIRKSLSRFFGYTTLSHRWGTGEPLLRDIQRHGIYTLDGGEGLSKLQSFCALTLRHGHGWAWSDTCCIDKESSSELQEAIGSMFSWYRNSALTIVYLSDVSGTTSFADSIWFKRGWTLQELLAAPRVLFYTQDWSLYMNSASSNHKLDAAIVAELQIATGIGELQLKNFSPGVLDVRSKLQWASTRYTTRAEDVAYSLFGIFQVSLPVIYGENTPGALGRLLAEIVSRSGDVSVLDWVGEASSFHSCFPTGLTPYRSRSWMQSVPSGPSKHNGADLEKGLELYNALARLSSPRFVSGRLELPCIVHRVASVKLLETSSATSYHDYELVASGLVPLKLKLSSRLQEGSNAGLPYVLVRPWSPKLLDLLAHDNVPGSLLVEWLRQPFNALLLHSPLHTEYKRVASDCSIIASVEDLASVVHSECQTLEIV